MSAIVSPNGWAMSAVLIRLVPGSRVGAQRKLMGDAPNHRCHPTEGADVRQKVVVARLVSRIEECGLNRRSLAKKAGLGESAVYDIVRGKNMNPSMTTMVNLASALNCDVDYLTGAQEHPRAKAVVAEPTDMRVIGTVEAGAFRRMIIDPIESEYAMRSIKAPPSSQYPGRRCFAMDVVGNSMNEAKPTPIIDGQTVLCVDFINSGLDLEGGKIYVVRRTRDSGSTYEWTIKRAVIFRDRVELRPESSDRTIETITIRNSPAAHDGPEHVEVIGLVYGTYASYE